MDPNLYCQQKALQSKSNFYTSFMFLPQAKRQAMTALYAFCREVDDIVDDISDKKEAETQLNVWREAIKNLKILPEHPVCQALQIYQARYMIPIQLFHDIIDGMEMDLVQNRYETFEALETYCYRVAGAVGVITVHILGFRNNHTLSFAKHLGTSLQLINIIRDVREDFERNRIYIPQTLLKKHQLDLDHVETLEDSPALRACLAELGQSAQAQYQAAMRILPTGDRPRQRVSIIMAKIYHEILAMMQADNFDVLNQDYRLSTWQKLKTAWRCYFEEKNWHKKQFAATELG